MNFYSVIAIPNEKIAIVEDCLKINLSSSEIPPRLVNDKDLKAARNPEHYIWVSGGGTYLINNRYIPVVKRSDDARINPGKYSLFTGRADNDDELLNPDLLIRELLEEVILFNTNTHFTPTLRGYRALTENITQIHQDIFSDHLSAKTPEPVAAEKISFSKRTISLNNEMLPLVWHINSNNEINILNLYSLSIPKIKELKIVDGEYYKKDNQIIYQNRGIYLFDTQTKKIIHQSNFEEINIDLENETTEHLKFLLTSYMNQGE